ncbi:MAG: sporulation integral membrane protein YlbJ [Clostridiales bacterium]|jgi:sporulation integral membrane protein YlbJ|nr:sporulation integral membrane protein YlbJ [Clostridiales bacterium]
MKNSEPMKKLLPFAAPLIIAFFNILLILFPAEMIDAAREGTALWFSNVLPSLLPFVAGINILSGLGFVSFIGTLLTPVMYPLFGVPGCGGFALITGMTSGYPMGAKTTAALRAKGELTTTEAQRLAGFVNNSGPLFILGAVGVGMFGDARAGYLIMAAHYISAVATGLVMKFYGRGSNKEALVFKGDFRNFRRSSGSLLSAAFRSMRAARNKDGRGFGEILGDSVKNAMETLVTVGGFIILFCVLVRAFELTEVSRAAGALFENFTGQDKRIFDGFFYGLIEMTNGTRILAEEPFSKPRFLAAAAVISFGGFSIHCQSINFLSKTDIKISIYLLSKAIHAALAVAAASLLSPFISHNYAGAVYTSLMYNHTMLENMAFSFVMFAVSILALLAAALMANAGNGCGKK